MRGVIEIIADLVVSVAIGASVTLETPGWCVSKAPSSLDMVGACVSFFLIHSRNIFKVVDICTR